MSAFRVKFAETKLSLLRAMLLEHEESSTMDGANKSNENACFSRIGNRIFLVSIRRRESRRKAPNQQ